MKLSWKDGVTTLLAVAVGAIAYALASQWSWPLVGDVRIAAIVVWAIGVAMCPVTWAAVAAVTGDSGARAAIGSGLGLDVRYYRVMSALALVPTGLAVWAVLAGDAGIVVAEAAFVLVIWLIASVAHLAAGTARGSMAPIS